MRVLHVIPAVAPRYGGTSAAIWPLTRALRELGECDVELATTDADGPGGRLAADAVPEGAVTVRVFPRDISEQLKYCTQLARWLKARAADYDLLHVHSNWNFPVAAACRAALRARVPFILSPHGMLSKYSWGRSKWKRRVYWRLFERRNVFQAAAFHVTSQEERQEVRSLGVRARVDVIPLGVDREAFDVPVDNNWLRGQCPECGDRPVVLYLSRLHPKKGITDFLLPAFARLKSGAFLVIVGGEDCHAPGYESAIRSDIRRLGLEGRVALLGPVPPDKRWAALDGADVFVLPSHAENFGIVVAEAMARGKPVVVTTGVQFAEHVRASDGGGVVGPDLRELSQALDLWLADAPARACAGARGKQYIQQHLSWRQTAERLSALYQHVCVENLRSPIASNARR